MDARKNGCPRGRHAKGEEAPARKAHENRFNSHSVSADISNIGREASKRKSDHAGRENCKSIVRGRSYITPPAPRMSPSRAPVLSCLHYFQGQGRSQDFSKEGSQTGTPFGDRRPYMVYTAALPRVSAGSVVLSRYEGPYQLKTRAVDENTLQKKHFKKVGFSTMAFTAKILSWRFRHQNIVGCLLKRRPTKGGEGGSRAPQDPPSYAPEGPATQATPN